MAQFNGDYQQLAAALLQQAGVVGAAAQGGGIAQGGPAVSVPVAHYAGDKLDIERTESHVAKWLTENCVDTNATVLQNVQHFLDHVSNVFKNKIALYETRDDMERMSPDAANPNAFSDKVSELSKAWNDAHPNWQTDGGDVRQARFEYLPEN